MFNPEQAEKDAREVNPTLDEAFRRKEAEKQRYLEPVIAYFAVLEEEIATMPISQRYRKDITPDFTSIGENTILPQYQNLTEAEFKRAQLLLDLQSARNRALSVIGAVEDLVMDMEATKRDYFELK